MVKMTTTYVFTDIHGCYNTFMTLWNSINPDFIQGDKVIFLGDYIDRGKDPIKVLQFIKGLTEQYPGQAIALKGNHEDMCVGYYKYRDRTWENNGFNYTKTALKQLSKEELTNLLDWMEKLPERYFDTNYRYCHSGYWPNELDYYGYSKTIWDRSWCIQSTAYENAAPTIFGHTPVKQVVEVFSDMFDIDTGCVYGNSLSCAVIDDDTGSIEFISVKNMEGQNNAII